MKRQLLLFTFLFSCLSIFAQRSGDATFYSNTGKKFFVVLNGVRQNTDAQTNVNISGLTENFYSCRIIAEDKSFNLEKNIGVKQDTLITYRIIEKKGKYKLRFYTESSLGTAPVPQDRVNVVYHESDVPQGNGTITKTNNGGNVSSTNNNGVNTTTSTTTTSTSTSPSGQSENMSININMNENGMGANVNIQTTGTSKRDGSGGGNGGGAGNGTGPANGQGVNGATINSTSTTTTTTSSTTTINGATTHSEESTTVTSNNNNGTITHFEETTSTNIGSQGNIYTDDDMTMTMNSGCGTSEEDIKKISAQINNEDFPDDKLRVAKMVASEKCMSVEQIKTISGLLAFDDNKMEFIKAAHTNCMNQNNYHQLLNVFTFSDDKAELEKFIHSK